jgi:hypothetical protein
MSKIKSHPREGVVYECYRGFVDRGRDRARKGQLFVVNNKKISFKDEVVMEKASGRGVCIIVNKDEFQDYFCPAASTPEEQVPSIQQGVIYSTIFHETNLWDVVEEYFELLPQAIQEWMKKEMPDRFDKSKAFEFAENDIFSLSLSNHVPFVIGHGLVEEKDWMKCLVITKPYTAEIFKSPQGHQCIRFVKQ